MRKRLRCVLSLCVFALGCASHNPIKPPSLATDLRAQADRKEEKGITVMARPIHTKKELMAYYDEDLVLFGVLPFQVSIKNEGRPCYLGVERASLVDPGGRAVPAMSLEAVFDRAAKSYWRTAGWGVAFGVVGAVPSLINVASTNEKIKADYETRMLKSGKMTESGFTEGSVFFEIDKNIRSLDGYQFKIGFDKEGEPLSIAFDLSGEVEQPRAEERKEAGSNSVVAGGAASSGTNLAGAGAVSAAAINPQKPWAGTWEIELKNGKIHRWALVQNGDSVVARGSMQGILRGIVDGNRLKGTMLYGDRFDVAMAPDGLSFSGEVRSGWSTNPMAGRRLGSGASTAAAAGTPQAGYAISEFKTFSCKLDAEGCQMTALRPGFVQDYRQVLASHLRLAIQSESPNLHYEENNPDLEIETVLEEIHGGNAAVRFWVGFGAGKSITIAHVKVKRNGKILAERRIIETTTLPNLATGTYANEDAILQDAPLIARKIAEFVNNPIAFGEKQERAGRE